MTNQPAYQLTDDESKTIAGLDARELEVELVCARIEAKTHERCGDHGCRRHADALVNAMLDAWQGLHAKTPA